MIPICFYESLQAEQDNNSSTIPSTIRTLRFIGSGVEDKNKSIASASNFISVLSKYTRIHCLHSDGIWATPYLQSPWLLQSIQVNELTYLELKVLDAHQRYLETSSTTSFTLFYTRG